jgi:hypothetical protein
MSSKREDSVIEIIFYAIILGVVILVFVAPQHIPAVLATARWLFVPDAPTPAWLAELMSTGAAPATNSVTGSGVVPILPVLAGLFVFIVLTAGVIAVLRRWSRGEKLVDSAVQKAGDEQVKRQGKASTAHSRQPRHKTVIGPSRGEFLE